MSQSTLPKQLPASDQEQAPAPSSAGLSSVTKQQSAFDLDYHPMPVMAPVALFLGISAFSALMGLFGIVLAAVGILVSLGCVLQIRASQGHLSGTKMAVSGGVLSAIFLLLGSYFLISDYKAELPPGYQRVNFPTQIAEKKFVEVEGRREIHPDVKPFVDQPIFVKGYIWQTRIDRGMSSFILLKDNGKCCFGGDPAPNDMIEIRMQDGKTFDYVSGLVAVAGVLRAEPNPPMGQPVYVLEAQHAAKAKTAF